MAAAVKWIDFYYEQPLVNKEQAIRNAKTLAASKQPVGVPALPVFDKKQYDAGEHLDQAVRQCAAGPDDPFTDNIFDQTLAPSRQPRRRASTTRSTRWSRPC